MRLLINEKDKDMDIDEAKQLGLLDEHNPWQMSEEIDKRFTIGEICDLWYALYGENMKEEYSGFEDELEQRIA